MGPNAAFLLPKGKEPSVPIWVSRIEGCEEGARAVPKKSGHTNQPGGVVPKEAARRVARKEYAAGAQLMPGGGKVWQGNAPVGMFLIDMGLITEAIWTVGCFSEVPLVELTLNVKRYLINHLISTMLSGQYFVYLFRQYEY